ncbi:glycosyltransferase family 4 protein [Myroides odoratimimus]|nr:glycosyltransferase family 4 protein [Myroides odoratimimus]
MTERSFEVIGVSSEGEELNDVKKEEGIRIVPLEMTRTISPIQDLKSLYQFYKLCKKEKPLMVHSHTPKAGVVGMLGAKLAGVPIRLHTVAGLPLMEVTGFKRSILNLVEKLTYHSATKVYPNSKGLYDFIVNEKFTSKSKLKVIGNGSSNGINTSFFSKENFPESDLNDLKKNLGIVESDFVFIFVGRLVGDKGINELVHAFDKLENKIEKEIKLLLVGPFESELDPLHNSTLQIIKENKNIISVGFQKDVRPYFAISNALVFLSYREGFPNVVMQAGAMELPSIVSNINGCNEIIEDGVNGVIIPVKNTEVIGTSMLRIVEDNDFYTLLKKNSREMIVTRYEQQVVWNALLKEYNSLIEENNSKK